MAAIINSKQLFRQFMTFNHAACQPKMPNANVMKFQFESKAPIKHSFPSKFLTFYVTDHSVGDTRQVFLHFMISQAAI